MADGTANRPAEELGEEGSLVLDQHFAIVPEWVIDAQISDVAYRLYSVLLRYGQSSGSRMPGRATLAARLHKSSTDTVDRALKELVAIGAVTVEHRRRGREALTNRYHLRSTPPAGQRSVEGGGRKFAATPRRTDAATPGRTDAATLAADLRPNPVVPTQKNPPPVPLPTVGRGTAEPPKPAGTVPVPRRQPEPTGADPGPDLDSRLLAACGISDLPTLAAECQQLRRRTGRPAGRWTPDRLLDVLRQAINVHGWPAAAAAPALRTLAADPATHSPTRLACPGPWWQSATTARTLSAEAQAAHNAELDQLEARLLEADGLRIWAQQRAREDLQERGHPLTRLNVARHACHLLDTAQANAC